MGFRTLSQNDPDFHSYLLGTFSKTERALPVQSLNVGTKSEQIVFQIVPLNEIQMPSFLSKWLAIFKIHHLLWVVAPAFLMLAKVWLDEQVLDLELSAFALLGVVFLLSGCNLYNDFLDHVSGVDRLQQNQSQKALQKGWVTAADTRFWALVFIGLGILLGLNPLLEREELLSWVLLPTSLALIYGIFSWRGFKYRWGAELALFCLMGPLLSIGYQIAFTSTWDIEGFLMGWLMGWLVVLTLHLKNFEQILVGSQFGFRNSIAYLGFEKSKRLIEACWIGFCLQFVLFHFLYTPSQWAWASIVPGIVSITFLRQLRKLESPAGSRIQSVVKMGRICVWLGLGIWLASTSFYFLWL